MNTADLYAMTDDQRLNLLLEQWYTAFGNKWLTSSELIAACTSPLFWHLFLGADEPAKLTIRLGKLLQKSANQQIGLYRIIRSRNRHLKIWTWATERIDQPQETK